MTMTGCQRATPPRASEGTDTATPIGPSHPEWNNPNVRGYSDREKRDVIAAAEELDRRLRELEKRRGY